MRSIVRSSLDVIRCQHALEHNTWHQHAFHCEVTIGCHQASASFRTQYMTSACLPLWGHHWMSSGWHSSCTQLHDVKSKHLNHRYHYLISRKPGPRFNIKMSSYQCRKSHCGDKTVIRSSYLHSGISYTGKMSSLYWIGAQVSCVLNPAIQPRAWQIPNCWLAQLTKSDIFGKQIILNFEDDFTRIHLPNCEYELPCAVSECEALQSWSASLEPSEMMRISGPIQGSSSLSSAWGNPGWR